MDNLNKAYKKFGYISKFRAIQKSKCNNILLDYQKNYNKQNHKLLRKELTYNPHLLLSSFYNLTINKSILKIIKKLLGDKIVLWNSLIFFKKNKNFVSFHQDLNYWEFKNANCLTVSLALTDSNLKNGCLHVVPSSHKRIYDHKQKFIDRHNLLGSNQSVDFDIKKAFPIILKPGEFSVHHGNIVHGSYPNTTSTSRVLYSMRFAKYNNPSKIYVYANYLYKPDKKKYFKELPKCKADFDTECLIYREKILQNSFRLQIKLKTKKMYWIFRPFEFVFLSRIFRKLIYILLK